MSCGPFASAGWRFIPPVKGGDVLRAPEYYRRGGIFTGLIHSDCPPALHKLRAIGRQVAGPSSGGFRGIAKSVALVLWGTDNLKTKGVSIAQALALLGAEPRQDSYGRVVGAQLIPLESLGRPRIDVLVTLSGIFRDLLPMQTQLPAEASWLAATADEDVEQNLRS